MIRNPLNAVAASWLLVCGCFELQAEKMAKLCKAIETSFESAKYGKVQFLVVTPPGYDDGTEKYSVLYWLHGSGGNRKAIMNCLAELPVEIDEGKRAYFWEKAMRKTAAAIEQKIIPPMIIVGCEAPKGEWKPEDKDLVLEELIAHVDSNYRSIPEQRGRSIEGFSKGSELLSHVVTARPDLYSSASMICGAWGEKRWVEAKEKIGKAGTRLRITVGTDDQWLKSAEKVRDAMGKADMQLQFELLQGVKHNAQQVYAKKGLELLQFHASSWKDEKGNSLIKEK